MSLELMVADIVNNLVNATLISLESGNNVVLVSFAIIGILSVLSTIFQSAFTFLIPGILKVIAFVWWCISWVLKIGDFKEVEDE